MQLKARERDSRVWAPAVRRSSDLIDPGLRATINRLVSGEAPWPLLLIGKAGTGKTCAALCLLDRAGGAYWTVQDLLESLIESQHGRLATAGGIVIWPPGFWRRVAGEKLLVLDEVGCRERVSDQHFEAVKRVIDLRTGKPFVAISNVEDLGRVYDARIVSRLFSGTVYQCQGKDRRLE